MNRLTAKKSRKNRAQKEKNTQAVTDALVKSFLSAAPLLIQQAGEMWPGLPLSDGANAVVFAVMNIIIQMASARLGSVKFRHSQKRRDITSQGHITILIFNSRSGRARQLFAVPALFSLVPRRFFGRAWRAPRARRSWRYRRSSTADTLSAQVGFRRCALRRRAKS